MGEGKEGGLVNISMLENKEKQPETIHPKRSLRLSRKYPP